MKTAANILIRVVAAVCFFAVPFGPAAAATLTPGFPTAARFVKTETFANYVEDIDRTACTCNGKKLYGKVKVVTSFADLKVKIVDSFPDLKVKTVSSFADKCGEWQFVESFPDFTIQFVESFPDLKIKFVESFPGM